MAVFVLTGSDRDCLLAIPSLHRQGDADRFVREIETEKDRDNWIDPRRADQPFAKWAEEFFLLCGRLAPRSQGT
jgi:hypothetical protein